ncbi:MAG TPA: hypothetical protein VEZ11_09585 [Thermoanaerobaculia bacterium]|nr:hypothetical protein [Thermoanaerobaculia bacterium]
MKPKALVLVRACCWLGAAFDAAMVVPMLVPPVGARVFGIENFHPGADYRFAMLLASALMLGWTALLLWASRKPLERKAVLLLTVVPVIAGLAAAGVFAVAQGLITAGRMAPTWIIQAALAATFTYAYSISKNE